MGVIYPAGSIIGRKKDNKKFCIIEIAKDGYYVADYPIGVQLVGQKEFLKDDEVGLDQGQKTVSCKTPHRPLFLRT